MWDRRIGWADGDSLSRRELLVSFGVGLLSVHPAIRRSADPPIRLSAQDSLSDAGPSGKLWDPARAGLSRQPVTPRDNDEGIQAIEKRIKCTCGCNLNVYTCRTTDFNCTVSPKMHQQVLALAEAGESAEQIVAAFVREYGMAVLMAPPKQGFNLAAYFTPALVILVVGVLLVLAMRRWVRRAARVRESTVPGTGEAPGTPAELERLRRELKRIDA